MERLQCVKSIDPLNKSKSPVMGSGDRGSDSCQQAKFHATFTPGSQIRYDDLKQCLTPVGSGGKGKGAYVDIKKDMDKHQEAVKKAEERRAANQKKETEMRLAKQKKETAVRVEEARERTKEYKKLVNCLPNHKAFNSKPTN